MLRKVLSKVNNYYIVTWINSFCLLFNYPVTQQRPSSYLSFCRSSIGFLLSPFYSCRSKPDKNLRFWDLPIILIYRNYVYGITFLERKYLVSPLDLVICLLYSLLSCKCREKDRLRHDIVNLFHAIGLFL